MGWRVLVVWECALKGKTRMDPGLLLGGICNWLENGSGNPEIRGLDNVHRLG
jgi:DNA mismatch endonuclease (patch repair protein)